VIEYGIWHTEYEEADKNVVELIESKFHITFPKDYIEFISKYHGGKPEKNRININENLIVTLEYLLTFLAFDELDILDRWNELKGFLPNKVIPFAVSLDFNVICFDFRENNHSPQVIYCDIEMNKRKGRGCIYYICDSFTELLTKLN
jgi:hypothetical protein